MLTYKKGNLFRLLPYEEKTYKIIPHIVNDVGLWGSGFVIGLSEKWPGNEMGSPEFVYRADKDLTLGKVQWANVQRGNPNDSRISVANMVAQHDTIRNVQKPIRYAALTNCMTEVLNVVKHHNELFGKYHSINTEIHAPKFGSDRARGNWKFIEELIEEIWISNDIPVTIYTI